MVKKNPHITKLKEGYLFSEIKKRKQALLKEKPEIKLLSLSIGDTTEAIPPYISKGMKKSIEMLASKETYTGYGPAHGLPILQKKIAEYFYKGLAKEDEVYISDGAKCDLGRLQLLFGNDVSVAIQDPAYPAYVDIAVIMGLSKDYNHSRKRYDGIIYMPCYAENGFFPDLSSTPRTDLIIFCSPNNPTGAVATRKQLENLVSFAKENKSIIIFDTAYAAFIQDTDLPKSIYEIEGAREVAIEVGSFSKLAGFTGIRLGWTIVPKELLFDDSTPVYQYWSRIHQTYFNSASNIAQNGGVAVLENQGVEEVHSLITHYMENARILQKTLGECRIENYGAKNAPYLWADFRPKKSWEIFEKILQEAHIISMPGLGFGPSGEGFLRFSAFASRKDIIEACSRLKKVLNE